MDFNGIEEKAAERFKKYTSNYDLSQPKIALKAYHTYRVADFCRQIALSINLSQEDVFIAYMCGLLHDIGRFEQIKRYNTFYDSQSVDHAKLSCEILFGNEGIIREFIPVDTYDELIYQSIYWHSAYRYPEEMDTRQKMFCDILRDADKVDIFRVNCETPLDEIHNVPIEEFYNSKVTKEVFQAFKEHHCVLRSLKKTAIDAVVAYCSLYWELVYEKSRQIAIEQGYLRQLASFDSQNDETKLVFSQIREELGLK